MRASRRPGVLLVLAIVVALLVPGLVAGPARGSHGPGARRRSSGAKGDPSPQVKVTWFTQDWTFVGVAQGARRRLLAGPGARHLPPAVHRPAAGVRRGEVLPGRRDGDASPAAPRRCKNVKLHRGAAIGGTVRAGGKAAAGARVVAANKEQNSFETTANAQGQYALGGLPPGSYSVFTYDKRKTLGGQEQVPPEAQARGWFKTRTSTCRPSERAGWWSTCTPVTSPIPGSAFVTAVSKTNGQFWTAKAAHGTVTFGVLYPGK